MRRLVKGSKSGNPVVKIYQIYYEQRTAKYSMVLISLYFYLMPNKMFLKTNIDCFHTNQRIGIWQNSADVSFSL